MVVLYALAQLLLVHDAATLLRREAQGMRGGEPLILLLPGRLPFVCDVCGLCAGDRDFDYLVDRTCYPVRYPVLLFHYSSQGSYPVVAEPHSMCTTK